MKILLVSTQDYIHHPVPSRHHYIFEILAERHEVHVAHFHVTPESGKASRKTKLIVEEATLFPFTSPLLHYTANAPYHYYKFDEILESGNYDVVIASNILAGSAVIHAAKKYNVPVIFDLKDWFPDSAAAYIENPTLKEIVRNQVLNITNKNLSNSTKITTVSPSLVAKLKTFGHDAELITNGVDTDLFKPKTRADYYKAMAAEPESRNGIEDKDFVIGFVGSVERWYGLDGIIAMMPNLILEHPNTKLLIVGDSLFTEYGKELRKRVYDLNLTYHVTFVGLKPYNLLPNYIAAMDVCTIPLMPIQWRNIALPNKFFEYTACGKPILTTPIPDMQAMGTDNLYVYNNLDEFVKHVRSLQEIPYASSNDVEKFSWRSKAAEFENVINKVTKKS